MLAYSLLLSMFPLALLALFVASQVLQSPEVESSVLESLQRVFPRTTEATLERALDQVRRGSAGFGVVALVTSVWIGASVWGALDTAFCRIYHVRCRSWVEQKRFALVMLIVVVLFMAATVAVPTAQSLAVDAFPFENTGLGGLAVLGGSIAALFAVMCVIYWTVPNRAVPWRAVWPGAVLATVTITAVGYVFPAYLSNVSTLSQFGTTFVFVLIVLVWFWVLAFLILVGAVVNAMVFERQDAEAPAVPADAASASMTGISGDPDGTPR